MVQINTGKLRSLCKLKWLVAFCQTESLYSPLGESFVEVGLACEKGGQGCAWCRLASLRSRLQPLFVAVATGRSSFMCHRSSRWKEFISKFCVID